MFDVIPQAMHLNVGILGPWQDVVKGDQSTWTHQWSEHRQILTHTLFRVVTVDEGKIDQLIAEQTAHLGQGRRCVGVLPHQIQTLAKTGECLIERNTTGQIRAAKWSIGEVEADQVRVSEGRLTPQVKGAAMGRSDLQHPFWREETNPAIKPFYFVRILFRRNGFEVPSTGENKWHCKTRFRRWKQFLEAF